MKKIMGDCVSAVFLLVLISAPAGVYAENIEAKLSTTNGSDAFQVQNSGGTPLLHVGSDGKLGIGTTSPTRKLDIVGGGIALQNDYALYFGGINTGFIQGKDGLTDSYLALGTAGNSRVTIDKDGKVGIGTNTPKGKLHIYSDSNAMYFSGSSVGAHDVVIDHSNPEILMIRDVSSTPQRAVFSYFNNGDLGLGGQAAHVAASMMLKFDGKVGIGTVTPQGTLDVNGSIYQRGSSLYADYVFQPNYKLETIEEHSAFMWKEKHLTAVPKARVDENGQEVLEVGSQRKGMLEELEKAHIYIEQLSSTVNAQNKMLTALKALVCKDHSDAEICR